MTNEIKENIRKAYNDIADKYLEWTEPTHKTRLKYLNLLLDSLNTTTTTTSIISNDSDDKTKEKAKGKGKVLELGCGAGIPCTQILAKRFNVTANDISDSQITLARKLLPESEYSVKFIQGDMMKLDFSTSTNISTSTSNGGKGEEGEGFDAVLAMYSIIHLPRPEQSEILQRIWTWLKPGGLFLANFSGEGFEGNVDDGWLGGNDGFMYWSGWGKEEIRRILGDVGFEIEIDEVVVDVEMEMDGKEKEVGFHWILARKKVGGEKT